MTKPSPDVAATQEPEKNQGTAKNTESAEVGKKTRRQAIARRLDLYFDISERGSTLTQETRSGVVTFFAMAYIIILNPVILSDVADVTGYKLSFGTVAAATALVAGVMTIIFGVVAKYPFGIAAGLGINSMLAVTIVQEVSWPEAMGLVVIDGVIIVILAITGFRTAVFTAIPRSLKSAIAVGIGLFISIIGFVDAGFVRRIPDAAQTTVPVGLGIGGSIASWPTAVFACGLLICGILVIKKVPGGLLIGIISTTIIAIIVQAIAKPGSSHQDGVSIPTGWSLEVPEWPHQLSSWPDLSLIGNVSILGSFTRIGVLAATLFVFTLVLANFFDAMGTMTGLGEQAGFSDKDGNLPDMRKALIVEGAGAVAGGMGSVSSNTVFVDSAAGIADGARTGFANVVTGLLFLAAIFFTPLYSIVPIEAAAPVLVIVGAMMMSQITNIDFKRFEIALPAFLTIVTMPFTYSIANGIGVGFIAWVIFGTAAGNAKRIHPLLWGMAFLFILYFAVGPITDAVS